MAGRPPKKTTAAQRELVRTLKADGWSNDRIARRLELARNSLEKHFAEDLEHGADAELAQRLKWARKAASKGNMTAIRWLDERQAMATAAREMEERATQPQPAAEKPMKEPAKGKKEILQEQAEGVTGLFAPPPPPTKPH